MYPERREGGGAGEERMRFSLHSCSEHIQKHFHPMLYIILHMQVRPETLFLSHSSLPRERLVKKIIYSCASPVDRRRVPCEEPEPKLAQMEGRIGQTASPTHKDSTTADFRT